MLATRQLDPKTTDRRLRRGDLVIAAASAASEWTDWKIIHTEKGPFLNEMLGDQCRWKNEQILSVVAQNAPSKPHDPTPLRILDFKFKKTK